MTKILSCTCAHEYQDARYGAGLRVHNSVGKIKNGWRCTVCSRIHHNGV